MTINEFTYEITTSHYDYGVPIVFEAGTEQGFSIGNEIIFIFDNEAISDKSFVVDKEKFTFNLALTKEEADSIQANMIRPYTTIKYSAKRYQSGQFLETLVDSILTVRDTLKWDGDNNG